MAKIIGLFLFFAFLTVTIGTLEWLCPAKREQRRFRTGFRVDLLWWVFNPLLAQPVKKVVIFVSLVPLIVLLGLPMDKTITEGHGFMKALPPIVQMPLMIVVGDFVGYWLHRLLHTRWLWPIHAVHHSPTELDWMSTLRAHPLNEIVNKSPKLMVLVALGFNMTLVAAYLPVTVLYMILIHSNTRIKLPGPLKYLIATPLFHRWHHANHIDACNFSMFPAWDLMFGTFHLPDHDPEDIGIDDPIPETLLGQLIWPLRPTAYNNTSPANPTTTE